MQSQAEAKRANLAREAFQTQSQAEVKRANLAGEAFQTQELEAEEAWRLRQAKEAVAARRDMYGFKDSELGALTDWRNTQFDYDKGRDTASDEKWQANFDYIFPVRKI